MAGEIIKTRGICLDIRPWSRTSHVVSWLTPEGKVTTLVKGAVRAKSAFLGQYDLNYTCEVLYYARAKGEVHALRECTPLNRRDELRENYRYAAAASYFRRLAMELATGGGEGEEWYRLLEDSLDRLNRRERLLNEFVFYEVEVLRLMGLYPEIEAEGGSLLLRGERKMPVSSAIVECLRRPRDFGSEGGVVDTLRVLGVYYCFHLDCASESRRVVLGLISKPKS